MSTGSDTAFMTERRSEPLGRVLVFDQDPALLALLSLVLQVGGQRVESVSTPQNALDAIRRQRPAVVVLGSSPAEPGGSASFFKLRQHAWPDIPLIVLATHPGLWSDSTVAAVLPKPFDSTELLGWIERLTDPSAVSAKDHFSLTRDAFPRPPRSVGICLAPAIVNTLLRRNPMQRVEKTIRVRAPAQQVYAFWRDFTNFPSFMKHVEEVRSLNSDGSLSHWKIKSPLGAVEFDARITTDEPGTSIGWNSVDGSMETSGEVTFTETGDNTEVHVLMQYYDTPGGALGEVASRLLQSPEAMLEEDLIRFKEIVEGRTAGTPGRSR